MIRICCTVCNVYRKLKNPKLSNIFGKILGFLLFTVKVAMNIEKIFKKGKSIEILKILDLIANIEEYQKYIIITEDNVNQKIRLKKKDEERNHFIEEINQNEMISKKHEKVCRFLNYIEHLLILVSTVPGCVSIYDFASSAGTPTV